MADLATEAICHAAEMAKAAVQETCTYFMEPSVLYRPRIYIDGDQWCALYGDNIQDGVCGFGDSPEKAMQDFNRNWLTSLTPNPQ